MSDSPAAPAAPSAAPAAPASAPAKPPASAPSSAAPNAPSGVQNVGTNAQVQTKPNTLPYQDSSAPAAGNNHPEAQPGETKAETAERLRFEGLKVKGKVIDREFTRDEAKLYLQKGLAFDENAQETAQVRKSFQSFIEAVKADPFAAFNDPAFGDLGKNYKQMVIQQLAKEFQAEELKASDPKAYEMQQLKEENERYRAEKEAEKQKYQAAVQAEQAKRLREETTRTWDEALTKAGLGATPAYHKQLAQIALDFMDSGLDPTNTELLISEMRSRMTNNQKVLLGGLKGPELLNYLGEDVVNAIMEHKVAALNAVKAPPTPIKAAETENTPVNEPEGEKFEHPNRLLRSFRDFQDGK